MAEVAIPSREASWPMRTLEPFTWRTLHLKVRLKVKYHVARLRNRRNRVQIPPVPRVLTGRTA